MEQINPLQTQTWGPSDPQEELIGKLLSNRPPLLSSPGSIVSNNLYYDASSCVVSAAEALQSHGRYKQSFNNTQMGATSSINIPNSSFLSGCYIYAEIGALPANCALPTGWLLHAIDSITYIVGSSNVSQIFFSGQSHAQIYLSGAETAEKRNYLLKQAGDYSAGLSAGPHRAQVQLQLPWSRISAMSKKLPFDTNILSSPITITINWRNSAGMYQGAGRANGPRLYEKLIMYCTTIDLMDKSLGLRTPLFRDPSLLASYPMVHCQSLQLDFVAGALDAGRRPINNLQLTQIANADLIGISISAVKNSFLQVEGDAGGLGPFAYTPLEDFSLSYNGLVLYDSPGYLHRLYDTQDTIGASGFNYAYTTGPGVSETKEAEIIFIPFTRVKTTSFQDAFFNSFRIANQNLSVQFRPSPLADYAGPSTLFITYYFNALIAVQAGISNLLL